MGQNEEIKALGLQAEELADNLKSLGDKQNSQYTDVMLLLKKIEDKLSDLEDTASHIETRSEDELYDEAKGEVVKSGKASTSYLQRKLGIGYSLATSLMDSLEAEGIIGPGRGSTPREVLVKSIDGIEYSPDKIILDGDDVKLYEKAKEAVMKVEKVSISFLQRKFGIGYSRSGMIIDKLEEDGIIETGAGPGPRKVLKKV